MKLALVQLEIEGGDLDGNLDRALAGIETAADRGADLVALPELWNVGFFAFESYESAAEPLDGPTLTRIAEAAAEHDVGVLAGSIVEDLASTPVEAPAESGMANTTVVFGRDGQRLGYYRKQHLFGYESEESSRLTPGERLGIVSFGGFKIGLTTCYDLRFPGLFEDLLEEAVTMVLVPSAWPYPRVEHWETLSRARAIENLAYLGAVNGVGTFGEDALLGRSAIIDPWGTAVAAAGDGSDIVMASVDPDHVDSVREDFPALRDRRR